MKVHVRVWMAGLCLLVSGVASAQAIPDWYKQMMQQAQQPVGVGVADLSKMSRPTCGGLQTWLPGWPLQPGCTPRPAIYEGPSTGLEECKDTMDLGRLECWRCENGTRRSLAAVDSPRACFASFGGQTQQFAKATRIRGLCPDATATHEKSFWDPIRGGECWACPKGFVRSTAHVEWADACVRPAAEVLFGATRHNRGTGLFQTDCPAGQFWDGYDGHCYSCPGGNRTGNHIASGQACSRLVAAQTSRATVQRTGKCEAGSFADPRNGGECWSCPEPFDRSVHPVDGDRACETTPGMRFERAVLVKPLACPAGQHWDPAGVTQAELNDARKPWQARVAKPSEGATCWSCPAEHKRTPFSVKSGDACEPEKSISWYSAPPVNPGVFTLDGADDLALEILRDHREDLDLVIREAVKACAASADDPNAARCRQSPEQAVADAWKLIADRPQDSPHLGLVMLHQVITAVNDPAKATKAETRVASAFAAFIQARKVYIAEDALKAFDAWLLAEKYRQIRWPNVGTATLLTVSKPVSHEVAVAQLQKEYAHLATGQGRGGSAQTVGVVPPDWYQSVLAGSAAGIAGAGVGAVALMYAVPSFRGAVFPNYKIRTGIKGRTGATGSGSGPGVGTSPKRPPAAKTPINTNTAQYRTAVGKVEALERKLGRRLYKRESLVKMAMKAGSKFDDYADDLVKAGTKRLGVAIGGAALFIGVAIEVAIEVIQKVVEIGEMDRGHLLTMIAEAKQPVVLSQLLLTGEGEDEIESYWAMAMSGERAPSSATSAQIRTYVALATSGAPGAPQAAVAASPAAQASTQVAALAADPRAWPKYFNGVEHMGPYAWLDAAQALGSLNAAVVGGQEGAVALPLCRASHQNGVHPGKLVGRACNIAWGGREVVVPAAFQVLVRNPAASGAQYPSDNWVAPNAMDPKHTFYGGYEGRNWMRVCRAQHNNGWHPGKEWQGRCNIGWGGKELVIAQYQVLSLYNTAAGGNRDGK